MAKKSSNVVPIYVIGDKNHPWGGLNTSNKDNREMEIGENYDQINWLTGRDRDNIQLRRGQALLGITRRNIANVHVSGIGVGARLDGIQIPFYSFLRKLMFLNPVTQDTQEVSVTDILPVSASGEDITFSPYSNVAGSFIYASSPNSSIYKIPAANPNSVVDQLVKDFHFAYFKFDRSRMIACLRQGTSQNSTDKTGLYLSKVDLNTPSVTYMSIPTPTLTPSTSGGSLANGTYYIVVTAFGPAGVETVVGTQVSTSIVGGTGAGSITVTFPNSAGATKYNIYFSTTSGVFNTPSKGNLGDVTATPGVLNSVIITQAYVGAPPGSSTQNTIAPIATGNGVTTTFSGTLSITAPNTLYGLLITDGTELFSDNRNGVLVGSLGGTGTINYATGAYSVTFNTAPTNGSPITASYLFEDASTFGVANFAIDATDVNKAQVFRQDDGGGVAQAIFTYQGIEYCLHVLRSWQFTLTATAFNNQPYYEQIGIPYKRAAFQTGDGIIFINNANPSQPVFSILRIPPGSTNLTVVPEKLSQKLDLSTFNFAQCVVRRWGDYDIIGVAVQNQIGIYNNYNSICFIRNIWSGIWDKIDYQFSCLEELNGMLIGGDSLSPNIFTLFSGFDDDGQIINNFYNHSYLNLGMDGLKTVGYLHVEGLIQRNQNVQVAISLDGGSYITQYVILGNAPYVSQGVSVGIGTYTMGSTIIGGQGSAAQFANKFEVDIPIHTDYFEYISFQFKALQVGHIQINKVMFKDIRLKRRR